MEVGGIKNGRFRNFLHPIELRRILKKANKLQLLFGFVWLCLFQAVFHSMWHKYGTKLICLDNCNSHN